MAPRAAPPRARLTQPKREQSQTAKTSHRPTAVFRVNASAAATPHAKAGEGTIALRRAAGYACGRNFTPGLDGGRGEGRKPAGAAETAGDARRRRCRSPLVAAVALLALLFQLIALPYHQARSAPIAPQPASDVASVAASPEGDVRRRGLALRPVRRQRRPPRPAGDCDDHCPLCQFAAQAATLLAPALPVLPARFDLAVRSLGAAPEAGAVPAASRSVTIAPAGRPSPSET